MSDITEYAGGALTVSVEDRIKTVTLNQPEKKNAINQEMSRALLEVVKETESDDSRVLILTGSGGNFCAGADLDPRVIAASGKPFQVDQFLKEVYNPLVLGLRNMTKPSIASVQGICVGAGWNFALACDLIYATPDARFSQIFTKIGLSSDGGGAYFLWERLGHHRAFELLAFHKQLSSEEALNLGLVNEIFAAGEIQEKVSEKALMLANGPFLAIQSSKSNLSVAESEGLEASLSQEADNQGKNFMTMDFMEGISAFLQKRKPKFRGK